MTVEYDEIGRRVKLSATGQVDTTYTYDAASQFKTVTKGGQTVTLNYDDAGRRTSLTYPNGVVTSCGHDNAYRLLSIGHVKTPPTIEALTYAYDKGGNRIAPRHVGVAMPDSQVSTPAILSGSSITVAPGPSLSMPYVPSAAGKSTTITPAVSESMP